MGPVDLDNSLDDPLLYLLHTIKLLIQDTPGLHRIHRRKIIPLPLDIHHNRQSPLSVALLLRGNLTGPGHRQIPSGPEPDIIRQSPPRTVHEISNTLDTGKLHAVPCFLRFLVRNLRRRRVAGEKPFDHKLEKSVLRGKLTAPAKSDLPDLVHCVSILTGRSREPYIDVILPQPLQQADKTGVDLKNIHAAHASAFFLLELEGCPADGIGKYAGRMMFQFPLPVVQHQHRMLRRSLRFAGIKDFIGTLRLPGWFR